MPPESWPALLADPEVRALVAYVGAVSREIGRREADAEMARSWAAAAGGIRAVLAQPTHAELRTRRGER